MTPSTAYNMLTRLATLNALPRKRKVYAAPLLISGGRNLTSDDLLTLEQAKAATGKPALADWDADAVFVRVETMVDLYRSLTPAGRKALAHREVIGGWFADDDADWDAAGNLIPGEGYDADGEYCSTPGHSDEVPSVADFKDTLEYCSHKGVLFLY